MSLCGLQLVHLPWCLPERDQVLFHFFQAPSWKLHHYWNHNGRPPPPSAFPFSHQKSFLHGENLISCPLSVQLDIQILIHLWMNEILIEVVFKKKKDKPGARLQCFLWRTFIISIYTRRPGRCIAITLHPFMLVCLYQITVVYDVGGVGRCQKIGGIWSGALRLSRVSLSGRQLKMY